MATISKDALESIATYVSELESELGSYQDDLAEVTLERDALLAELQRIRATGEVV